MLTRLGVTVIKVMVTMEVVTTRSQSGREHLVTQLL